MFGGEHADVGDCICLGFSEEQVDRQDVGMSFKHIKCGTVEASCYKVCGFALD